MLMTLTTETYFLTSKLLKQDFTRTVQIRMQVAAQLSSHIC